MDKCRPAVKDILCGVLDTNRGRLVAFTMNGLDQTEYNVMHAAESDDQDEQLLYLQHLEALIPETLLTRIGRILLTDFDFNDIMTYFARLTSYFGLEYSVQMDISHILWCAKNLRIKRK